MNRKVNPKMNTKLSPWVCHENPVHHSEDYPKEHLKDVVEHARALDLLLKSWICKAQHGEVNVPCPLVIYKA